MSSSMRISAFAALLTLLVALSGCSGGNEVTVPNVTGEDPEMAYELLHRAGFRVSTSGSLSFGLRLRESNTPVPIGGMFVGSPVVQRQEPLAGRVVDRGFVVEIATDGLRGSERIFSCDPYPETVPNLIGKTLGFLGGHESCFSIVAKKLPPLDAADAPSLLDNYVVSRQTPAAGGQIAPLSASNPPGYATLTVEVRAVGE